MAFDRELTSLIRRQAGLVTRRQALANGMTKEALRYRLRPGGPWTPVVPGVYYTHDGVLTPAQREIAASLYVDHGCVLTGTSALLKHGVVAIDREMVDVLVPPGVARQNAAFITVRRTRRMPSEGVVADAVRYAPVPRAVADAIRFGMDSRSARALVATALQRRHCTFGELAAELRDGPRQGSAIFREVLSEASAGPRSVAEMDLRKLIIRHGLPTPLYNPRLMIGRAFIAQPDAWWSDANVACEVDSVEWHISPDDWQRTMSRQTRMKALGILVMPYTPRRIRTDDKTIAAELRSAIERGRSSPPVPIITIPTTPRSH